MQVGLKIFSYDAINAMPLTVVIARRSLAAPC